MKPIGGYFELAFPAANPSPLGHKGVYVNSGRNALEFILRGIGPENISKLYIPYYTCEVVLQPILSLGIKYEFYHVDLQLRIANPPELREGEYIVVNNYFGILDQYVAYLTDRYSERIIVDNSQALMTPCLKGQKAFYSPRKFVGIPDGGIACTPYEVELEERENDQDSISRTSHLLKRLYGGAQYGYSDFKKNSSALNNLPLKMMSSFTEKMLQTLDFESMVKIRKANYDTLRSALESFNKLETPTSEDISCPMVYPFLSEEEDLRGRLISEQIFVATYWPNVAKWCKQESVETTLSGRCLPIPVDQRYGSEDMKRIIIVINNGK